MDTSASLIFIVVAVSIFLLYGTRTSSLMIALALIAASLFAFWMDTSASLIFIVVAVAVFFLMTSEDLTYARNLSSPPSSRVFWSSIIWSKRATNGSCGFVSPIVGRR